MNPEGVKHTQTNYTTNYANYNQSESQFGPEDLGV